MAHLGHGVRGAVLTADAALSATVTNDPDPEHARLSESSGSAAPEPSAAGPLARTRALAKRHWPFLVVLALGLMLRVVTQVAYRPALLYIDSYRYLDLVRTTNPETSQPLGYVFFLWPVLKLGNLFVVVVLQHVMGLGIGVAIYVLCMRYGVSRWIAAAATIPILLDAYQLQIEQNVMSETLFEALLVGGMLALLWNRRPSTRALVIGGVLLGASVPVRIVALPAIVPAVIFAFVCGPGGWRRLGRAATSDSRSSSRSSDTWVSTSLRQATGVLRRATRTRSTVAPAQIVDCKELSYPSYEELLCPKVPLSQRVGVDYYAHTYPSGELVTPPPGQTFRDVLRDFTRRVFRSQPLDLAHAVAIDFLKGFRWDRTDARGDVTVKRWQFQTYFPNLGSRRSPGGHEAMGRRTSDRREAARVVPTRVPDERRLHARAVPLPRLPLRDPGGMRRVPSPAIASPRRSSGSRRSRVSPCCSRPTSSNSRGATNCLRSSSRQSPARSASPRCSATRRRATQPTNRLADATPRAPRHQAVVGDRSSSRRPSRIASSSRTSKGL